MATEIFIFILYLASGTVKKVIEINPYLLGTMAGGAGVSSYGIQVALGRLIPVQPTVSTGKRILASSAGCTS
jgi:hypothetical protein